MRLLLAILLVSAALAACDYSVTSMAIGSKADCSDAMPVEQARVYAGEDYYVCGALDIGGARISAYEESIMPQQEADTRAQGRFILHGKANTEKWGVYYIKLELEEPCEGELMQVPVEVRTRCVQLPPSTVQAVPNAVEEGKSFAIEVANADKDLDMQIQGLAMPITARIVQGEKWTRSVTSQECAPAGQACTLRFSFVEAEHPICRHDGSAIEVRVREEQQATSTSITDPTLGIAVMAAVVIVGTGAGVFALSRA
ncbi:MAG: hypothetical protein JW834_03330 [Candidatus Diapherotrites archaeon]|nr:hypothetical protein [Candidatus Diapherotrites archaeon]